MTIEILYSDVINLGNTHLNENHNDTVGHFGITKTLKRIQQKFDWINLEQDVTDFVKRCDICQRHKTTLVRLKETAILTDTPMEPNEKVALDIVGPLHKTKSIYTFYPRSTN